MVTGGAQITSSGTLTINAGTGGGLFLKQANLDGLSVGGPFFRNPLG